MKLLFLLLLCFLILSQSARSPGLLISGFTARRVFQLQVLLNPLFKFCHSKYLNRRIMYSFGNHGTFNPAVITNKENVQISEGVIHLKHLALGDDTLVDLHNSS